MTGSLAFRKNESSIRSGAVPDKFLRLLPYIPRGRILEVGSAEGVLALLLAKRGDQVTALEKSAERHDVAQQLYSEWLAREEGFTPPQFVNGSIQDNLGLLDNKDTFVAIRAIYYFGVYLDSVFAEVARKVQNVVLCGNRNRAERWRQGNPDPPLGDMNRYATREGMVSLLEKHGFRIVSEVREGDEIVVGRRD